MKKLILAFVLVLFAAPAFGQLNEIGLKFGGQSTGLYSDPIDVDERRVDFSIYTYGEIGIYKWISAAVDLGYIRRGYSETLVERGKNGEIIGDVTANSRLDYLSLATQVQGEMNYNNLALFGGIGPRFDYLVQKKAGVYEFSDSSLKDDLVSFFDPYTAGIRATAGIKNISLKQSNLRVELHYEVDVTDSMSDYPRSVRNYAFLLTAGIGLPL